MPQITEPMELNSSKMSCITAQGREIVQTMNSDPGLAVGKRLSFLTSLRRLSHTKALSKLFLSVRLHCFQRRGL